MLSDEVAEEVSRLRRAAGLNRDQLADRCADLGLPLSAAAIANIETGRRGKDGERRREVTVDELVVLARALQVTPLELVMPLAKSETIEVFPGHRVPRWQAVQWFAAEAPLTDGEPGSGQLLALFRQHAQLLAEVHSAQLQAASARLSARGAEPEERSAIGQAAESYERAARTATDRLVNVRQQIRALDATPPDLGPWSFLDEGVSA